MSLTIPNTATSVSERIELTNNYVASLEQQLSSFVYSTANYSSFGMYEKIHSAFKSIKSIYQELNDPERLISNADKERFENACKASNGKLQKITDKIIHSKAYVDSQRTKLERMDKFLSDPTSFSSTSVNLSKMLDYFSNFWGVPENYYFLPKEIKKQIDCGMWIIKGCPEDSNPSMDVKVGKLFKLNSTLRTERKRAVEFMQTNAVIVEMRHLLQLGNLKKLQEVFATLPLQAQKDIAEKHWVVCGRPTENSVEEDLRAIAHPDFGRISFLGLDPSRDVPVAKKMQALDAYCHMKEENAILKMCDLLRQGNTKRLRETFATLPTTARNDLCGKHWEVCGKPTENSPEEALRKISHPRFGKVSFLSLDSRCDVPAAKKIETLKAFAESKHIQLQLPSQAALDARASKKIDNRYMRAQEQMQNERDKRNFVWKHAPADLVKKTYGNRASDRSSTETVGKYKVGICHIQGRRPEMEDAHGADSFSLNIAGKNHVVHYFAIYDGHGRNETRANDVAAKYAKDHFTQVLRDALLEFNPQGLTKAGILAALEQSTVRVDAGLGKEFPAEAQIQGTTASIVIQIDDHLYGNNVGDARSVLGLGSTAIQLTEDAKPKDPHHTKRIEKNYGFVDAYNSRVNSSLATAGAIGDHVYNGAPSPKGVVTELPIPISSLPADSYLIVACDGVFDVVSTKQLVQGVHENKERSVENLARDIVYSAHEAWSSDNISCMVIKLA